jgi:hypothetical protein
MWIFKGTLLALWLVGFGTLLTLYLAVFRALPNNTAVDATVFALCTIRSAVWWIALVTCFAASIALTRAWKGPLAFWIILAVTGLIPAGALALFVTLFVKAHYAA